MIDPKLLAGLAFIALAALAGSYVKGFADGSADATAALQAAHAEQVAAIEAARRAEAARSAELEAAKAGVSGALAAERQALTGRLASVQAELKRLRNLPDECALTEAEALNLNELRRVRRTP